jgi:hypothetical protein
MLALIVGLWGLGFLVKELLLREGIERRRHFAIGGVLLVVSLLFFMPVWQALLATLPFGPPTSPMLSIGLSIALQLLAILYEEAFILDFELWQRLNSKIIVFVSLIIGSVVARILK